MRLLLLIVPFEFLLSLHSSLLVSRNVTLGKQKCHSWHYSWQVINRSKADKPINSRRASDKPAKADKPISGYRFIGFLSIYRLIGLNRLISHSFVCCPRKKNLGKTKITKKTNPGRLFSQIESTGQRVAQDWFFWFFWLFWFFLGFFSQDNTQTNG